MDKMGYPKLELGLSAISKDQLADNLAYNSLKVYIFLFLYLLIFVRWVCGNRFVVILIIIYMLFVCQGFILN
jgi:maltodextrin utilization protein YvdJ